VDKDELCCIVNTVDICVKCRQKKCDTHSFRCEEDGLRYCRECNVQAECGQCGAPLCKSCTKINSGDIYPSKKNQISCPTCIRIEEDSDNDDYSYSGCPCGCDG